MTKPPDTVRIALTCADGTLALMTFVTHEYRADGRIAWSQDTAPETVAAEIARASLSFDPEKVPVVGWRFVDLGDIPEDRTYRNAWRDRSGQIVHDMVHARVLHRDLLREWRAPRLAELDTAYLRADETNNEALKAQIAQEKRQLRDMPTDPRIEAAQTIEELKALLPNG